MNDKPKIVGKCVCCQKDRQEITFPLCSKECLKNEWRSQNFLHLAELAKRGGRRKQETEGTEIMKSRPGIIISSNELNKWGERYIFLPVTSKKVDRIYPFEILLNFQGKKGKALPDQIKTYSHSRIIKKLGILDPKYYPEIAAKLKEVFNFSS